MGSFTQTNPLKRVKFHFRPNPSPKTLKIRSYIPTPYYSSKLTPIELKRAMEGETIEELGVIHLTFDIGMIEHIQAIVRTLKQRRNQTVSKPMQFGWLGQNAYDSYLNFFSKYSDFTVTVDRPLSSPIPKPYDFDFRFPNQPSKRFRVEVKTVPYLSRDLSYFRGDIEPDFVVGVRALDEEMTKCELYGFTYGIVVKKFKSVIRYGKPCHRIPLNRANFDYYTFFHTNLLGLPFKEKFGD